MYRQIERMQGIGKTVIVDNVGSSREGYNIKKHSLLSFAESKGSAGGGGEAIKCGLRMVRIKPGMYTSTTGRYR